LSERAATEYGILIIVDPDEHRAPAEFILRRMFGLTSAEVRIATDLLRGRDLNDIAATSGAAGGTIRSQLKSILSKTETHRQAELVALLARIARVSIGGTGTRRLG
jgi:DNA-binding NarL/FixJ family response regulator